MKQRATAIFPFAIAIALPPAGALLGIGAIGNGDRDLGIRIIVTAVIAAIVWVLLLT